MTAYYSFCVLSALLFFGSTSYVINVIRFGNPFGGIQGAAHISSIMDVMLPAAIRDEPYWSRFLHILFSDMNNHVPGNLILKTPFTITQYDWIHMFRPANVSVQTGWGVWYSGILIISIIVIFIYIVKASERRNLEFWIATVMTALVFIPIPFVPALFTARYYVQLFLPALIALIILFVRYNKRIEDYSNKKPKRLWLHKLLIASAPAILSMTIIFNAYPHIHAVKHHWDISRGIDAEFQGLITESQGRPIYFRFLNGNFNGVIVNMRDAGITNKIIYYPDLERANSNNLFHHSPRSIYRVTENMD